MTGFVRERSGASLPGIVPSNTYLCGDGQYVVIGANGDSIFKRMMRAIGREDLANDPGVADNAGRTARTDELDAAIGAWTGTHPLEHVLGTLDKADVPSGRIFSMNLSAPAQVVGDGASSLRQLILAAPLVARCRALQLEAQRERLHWIPPARETIVLAFARSLRLGATLTDARQLVTPALLARFDEIADGIKDFYFGRFDVRFERLAEFQCGENFQIVEVNGVGAEANHIWDANTTLRNAYKTLFAQYKLAFHIGHLNRQRGCQPVGARALWRFFINQQRVLKLLQRPVASAK